MKLNPVARFMVNSFFRALSQRYIEAPMRNPWWIAVGHPFKRVREGYWSSTTSMFEPDWAWVLYLAKGAVGVGQKQGVHFFVWAVCDENKKAINVHSGEMPRR